MTAQIIQFIPRTEHLVRDLSEPMNLIVLPVVRVERFSDDVQPVELPSDSEPS